MTGEQIVQLDPAKVYADPARNAARFAPRDISRQEMMDSILAQGGVLQPVEVEAFTEVKGYTHRLNYGYRRHAAVLELNKSQAAGLQLPAIVREIDPADIVKRQIAENNDRENMSPMDKATAIKALLDQGVEKPEIRRIFSSITGKKGDQIQPMSNALLNIYLNFLQLPKSIQEKIHTGAVGVSAAYMLGKVSPDKRAAVLERAERDRAADVEREEKDEATYLAAESKVEKALATQAEALKLVDAAKLDIETAETQVKDRTKVWNDDKKRILTMTEAAGPADSEGLKAKEADVKAAQKLLRDAKNKLVKATENSKTAEEKAQAKKDQLEAARSLRKKKAGKSKGDGLSRDDVKKAAAKEGEKGPGLVPLNLSDIRQGLKDVSKAPGFAGKVGGLVLRWVEGNGTPKLLIEDLMALAKPAPKAAAAAPADKA